MDLYAVQIVYFYIPRHSSSFVPLQNSELHIVFCTWLELGYTHKLYFSSRFKLTQFCLYISLIEFTTRHTVIRIP